MDIQIDTREKARAITKIVEEFEHQDIRYYSSKLDVGDYMSLDNARLIIDRKQSLNELCGNVCQGHERFIKELRRAKDRGIRLVILCEHGRQVKTLDDVRSWVNPRLKRSPLAVSGERLHKILTTLSAKYGVTFLFCTKAQTGKRIIEILRGDYLNPCKREHTAYQERVQVYEIRKTELQQKNLSAKEYEKELRRIAEELRL